MRLRRTPEFQVPAFRLRAISLAVLATAAGIAALVVLLTPVEEPQFYVPRPAATVEDPPWPDGFVELESLEWARSASAPVNASASTSASAKAPQGK